LANLQYDDVRGGAPPSSTVVRRLRALTDDAANTTPATAIPQVELTVELAATIGSPRRSYTMWTCA